jgi:predicted kinase
MPQLKPFSDYKNSDWIDYPVKQCVCEYCNAYKKAHPQSYDDHTLPSAHSPKIFNQFLAAGGELSPLKWESVDDHTFEMNNNIVFTTRAPTLSGDGFNPDSSSIHPVSKESKKSPEKKKAPTGGLDCVREKGFKVLYLIRGIPGSGKSTLAAIMKNTIQRCGHNTYHYEADDFFVNHLTGEYHFDATKLGEAHAYCQVKVDQVMEEEKGVVIVSNTFVYRAHLEPYLRMAKKYGYTPIEITCNGNFKSIHEVPPETIRKMKQNFER